ncbi:MAG: response regulator, partial [Acidisphaera sp.]|nr:response regulator [Acidisphaera sp.]
AMEEGGTITISAANRQAQDAAALSLAPGDYVTLSVTDTGEGIAPAMLEQVMEPFFTTKPVGKGTGLGLSMVYGFARQSGGQVRIHSTLGVGTSVSIYLRAADALEEEEAAGPSATPEGDGQLVLVVEDDPSVRLLIRDALEELSYHVLEAAEADTALPILRSDRSIRLMISDVGLPGMNGRQLAEIARQHRPDLPILFVTGYAENAIVRSGFLGTNMAMIAKPFALEALGAKVSEMLHGVARPSMATPVHVPSK